MSEAAMKTPSLFEWRGSRSCATSWPADPLDIVRAMLQSRRLVFGVLVSLALASVAITAATAIAAPLWETLALCLAVCCSWGLWLRVTQLKAAAGPKLSFFTGDTGTLRLSEDLTCSKVVYCIGIRNEGSATVRDVHVNVDLMEDVPAPMFPARLRVFGREEDCVVLQPNESEYFCVMKIVESPEDHAGRASLCCDRDLMSGSIHLLELFKGKVLTVSAVGESIPKVTSRLRVVSRYDRSGWSLAMTLSPGST
jgi:hypothetical protein